MVLVGTEVGNEQTTDGTIEFRTILSTVRRPAMLDGREYSSSICWLKLPHIPHSWPWSMLHAGSCMRTGQQITDKMFSPTVAVDSSCCWFKVPIRLRETGQNTEKGGRGLSCLNCWCYYLCVLVLILIVERLRETRSGWVSTFISYSRTFCFVHTRRKQNYKYSDDDRNSHSHSLLLAYTTTQHTSHIIGL